MKKQFLVIVCCSLLLGISLKSMEEQEQPQLYQLPGELKLKIAGLLGDTPQEFITSLIALKRVDRDFYNLIKAHSRLIAKEAIERFGLPAIKRAFEEMLRNEKNFGEVRMFEELHLLNKQEQDEIVYKVFKAMVDLGYSERIKELFAAKIVTPETPRVVISHGQMITKTMSREPVKLIEEKIINPRSESEKRMFEDVLTFLAQKNLWDLSKPDLAGMRPAEHAVMIKAHELAKLLGKLEADQNRAREK